MRALSIPDRQTTSTWLRRSVKAAAIITCVLVVLWVGLHFFLASAAARRIAGKQLSAVLGQPVSVEHLAVGNSRTEAKLRIGDEYSVDSASADLSLADILAGGSPSKITLKGVRIDLAFDRDGKLLSKLPKPGGEGGGTPRLVIHDAVVNLRGEGRPAFHLENAELTANPVDGGYEIAGSIRDPGWGDWTIAGRIAADSTGWLELSTKDAPIDSERIRSLPPVPEVTWEHVGTAGRAALTIRFELTANSTNFRVDIVSDGRASVVANDVDAPLENVTGLIRVAGPVVELIGCEARLAGGVVKLSSRMDFTSAKSKLAFEVAVRDLDLIKLPAAWGLPQNITGRLRGQAKLDLSVDNKGRLEPRGGGEATLDEATLAGLPAEVTLRLRGDGKRYRFESESALLPQADDPQQVIYIPSKLIVPPAEALPTTLDTTVTLRDIDITQLLKQFEIQTPVTISGKVTAQLKLAVAVGSVVDRRAYQFHGSLTSKAITIEGLNVENIALRMRYRNGVFTVMELHAEVPRADGAPGLLTGTASVGIEPRGDVTAEVVIQRLPLEQIAKAFPDFKPAPQGTAELKASFRSRLDTLKDPKTWTGEATLTGDKLQAGTTAVGSMALKAVLDSGVAKLAIAKAELFRGTIRGTANVPLTKDLPGSLTLDFVEVDSAAATGLIPGFPVPLTGRLSGTMTAKSTAGERRILNADVNLTAPKLTVRGVPAEKLTGSIRVAESTANYSLEGHILGGTFEVKGSYPAKENERGSANLRDLDLARVSPAFKFDWLKPLKGRISATFDYDADGSIGSGRVATRELSWGRTLLANDLAGDLILRDNAVDLRDFGGDFADGRLRLRSRYDFNDPRRNFYSLQVDRASLRRLNPVAPSFLKNSGGDVSIAVRGRFGSQASAQITLAFATTTIGGFTLTDTRLPVEWTGNLERGSLAIHEGVLYLGHGKLTANIRYDYGAFGRVAGTLQFQRVPLAPLIGSAAKTFGNGTISGRFDLTGDTIRTLDDVTGTLNATLNQTSVREVPLLSVVEPFLSPIGFLKPFDAGEVKGRLSKGVFRIERLTLSNPGAHIFAEGTVTNAGRIDLDVIAVTGQVGPNVRGLQLLGVNLSALAPLPITVVIRVSDLLSNRMIRLSITGTLDAPRVQINKAALITDNAARFFLGQYAIPERIQIR